MPSQKQYNPGEIIEEINEGDGSDVVVKSGTYTMTDVTTHMNGTTSFQVITEVKSRIPPPGTKRVYYRFWWQYDVQENSGISNHILKIDDLYVNASAVNIAPITPSTTGIMHVFRYQLRALSDVTEM